jgi:hypothetical protein
MIYLLILHQNKIVSKVEIEALINIYKGITKNIDRMDRLKFRDVLHNSFDMTDDILMDRGIVRLISTLVNCLLLIKDL